MVPAQCRPINHIVSLLYRSICCTSRQKGLDLDVITRSRSRFSLGSRPICKTCIESDLGPGQYRQIVTLSVSSKYFLTLLQVKQKNIESQFSSSNSNICFLTRSRLKLRLRLGSSPRIRAMSYSSKSSSTAGSIKLANVCVEGNIGCGKTTLLNYFEGLQNCEVVAEPVEKWQNIEGYNALGLMYKDPERWGMALQTYIQLTMLQIHSQKQAKDVRLMERSIYSAKYCFTDNLYESGKMPGIEHVILTKWFEWILATQDIKVDLIVYLRTDPEVLHHRILKRCRKEEEGIPVVLLKALHQKYEDWLIHKKHPCPADVLVIDANHTLEEMEECYETYKSKILVSQAVK